MLMNKKHALNQILGPSKDKMAEGGEVSSLRSCVEELISAVHEKDVDGALSALRACFAELEAEPHEEGPHTGEY